MKNNDKAHERDTFLWYLSKIGQYPLISREQEIVLAKRIAKGDKSAKEELALSNLRLVVKIALDYSGLGMDDIELVNEGNIGLMKAVEKFDPKKGAKFSTYAAWWIKQSIKRALSDTVNTIRIPIHEGEKFRRARRALDKYLAASGGCKPNQREMVRLSGMSYKKFNELEALLQPVSLHSPKSPDGEVSLGDMIEDQNIVEPDEDRQHQGDIEVVTELLTELTPRERDVIKRRFGFGCEEETLEDVGTTHGITRERARQIQRDAIFKLKRLFLKRNRQHDVFGLPVS
jgi:RNA polymerase primary sigma factor